MTYVLTVRNSSCFEMNLLTHHWVHVNLPNDRLGLCCLFREANVIRGHENFSRFLQGVVHFRGHVEGGERHILSRQENEGDSL